MFPVLPLILWVAFVEPFLNLVRCRAKQDVVELIVKPDLTGWELKLAPVSCSATQAHSTETSEKLIQV